MSAEANHGSPHGLLLERAVLLQFSSLYLFTTWAFGGQAPWARLGIALLGGAGIALFFVACWLRRPAGSGRAHPALKYLWPLWLYDALVITSCFNPGFREVVIAGEPSLVMARPNPWLPSAALPRLAARELWQFNALLLSAFNLFLVLQRRSRLRQILLLLAGNAVALAVFGTFQKLAGAPGLWFGAVASPQPRFFATFIYHNHWGAFVVLSLAVCLALLFYYERRGGLRDGWHSPLLLGAVATLLLAASVPLSASRSCTVLAGLLLVGALGHFLLRLAGRWRAEGRPVAGRITLLLLTAFVAAGAVGYLGRKPILERSRQTYEQLIHPREGHVITSRLTLYRDTWRMAAEKPWFGWGLESYARVFRIFNTQRAAETWVWIPYYAEAHNDWLQSLAETGFVGTGLLVALGLAPLASLLGRHRRLSTLPAYLLTGCALLLLYAWLEFPFANPAVLLTFCAVFYGAVRYAQLDARARADNLPRHG